MKGKERGPAATEIAGLATALGQRFIHRWDMYPQQLKDGRYRAVKRPLLPEHLYAHLQGEMTLGAYVLDEQSRSDFLIVDADGEPDWRRLQALALALREMRCASYLERSRRGGHLWLFLGGPIAGREVRLFGKGLLAHFGIADIELFPKQNKLSTGPGSLIRLPFGVHQKSGRRYGFYTAAGEPLAPTLREQIMVLWAPETVPEAVFERFRDIGSATQKKTPLARPTAPLLRPLDGGGGEGKPWSTQIKEAISVRQFVLRYVELSPSGLGLCPFHDDNVASFNVNDEHNFWHCFACGAGGSIIDFWMKMQECDFTTAVRELRDMLLGEGLPADGVGESVVGVGEQPLALS
jgi:hypothetical protein